MMTNMADTNIDVKSTISWKISQNTCHSYHKFFIITHDM